MQRYSLSTPWWTLSFVHGHGLLELALLRHGEWRVIFTRYYR